MKSFLLFTLICLTALFSTHANEYKTDSKIKHVTVFLRGAQIERSNTVAIKPGRHNIVFTGLSSQIDQNSIRLKGNGVLTILSIHFQKNYLKNNTTSKKVQAWSDSLKTLKRKKSDLADEQLILNEEKDLLIRNKVLASHGNHNSTEELIKRANFFRTRLTELTKKLSQKGRAVKKINETIARIQQQINQENRNNKVTGEVVVEVDAEKSTTANLSLSYMIHNAGWYPVYNIYGQSTTQPLELNYNAKIYQRSEIDWNKVDLTLSTTNPSHHQQKPVLNTWWLNFLPQRSNSYRSKQSNRYSAYQQMEVVSEDADEITSSGNAEPSIQLSPPVNVTQQETAIEFDLKTKYTIPSNNKHHSVMVATYSIPAEYSYYVAPKKSTKAFLLAQSAGWYKYNLISGNCNYFFNNTFIGKSQLNLTGAVDTLDLPLGVDERIIVERKRVEDFCKVRTLGSTKKETIGLQITIKNTKPNKIKLTVQDQIPVSKNNQIEVVLENNKKGSYNEKTGILTWEINLKPGETKHLDFSYSVTYPKDRKIGL